MATSTTSTADHTTARCIELAAIFQDQLLEDPLPASAPGAVRRRQLALITAARAACRECPLIIDCLYRAVVDYDIAGYAAGTTPAQRIQIRRQLGITVEPEDFDTLATPRSCGSGTQTRTRASRCWRSASAALCQRSSVTYAASVASPLRVLPQLGQPSLRFSLPRPR
jgi:hypothetical protein